jgi:hypothetical protein
VLNRDEVLRSRIGLRAFEVAALCGLSRASVSRAISAGQLQTVQLAGVVLVPVHALAAAGLLPGDRDGDSAADPMTNASAGGGFRTGATVSDAEDTGSK